MTDGSITAKGDIKTDIESGGVFQAYDNEEGVNNSITLGADDTGAFINSTYTLGGTGAINFRTVGSYKGQFDVAGNFKVGGTSAAPNIELKGSDGSFTTAGMVVANGGLEAYIPTNNLQSFIQRWFDDRSSERSVAASMGVAGQFFTKSSVFVGGTTADANIQLTGSDGSITAAGSVDVGELTPGSDNDKSGVRINPSGAIQAGRPGSDLSLIHI